MKKTVCVFGGVSKSGADKYAKIAHELGHTLGNQGVDIVCSGTRRGMIGSLIDGASGQGARIIAVIVEGSGEIDLIHPRVHECIQTHSLADRKNLMLGMADLFISLPGGIGTLDEVFNVIASARMGLHEKKTALLNIDDFFAPLSDFLKQMVAFGFLKPSDLDRLIIECDVQRLMERLGKEPSLEERAFERPF